MARLHEHKGKDLLREFKIPTPNGILASNPHEVFRAAEEIGSSVVIKAQIWATGRAGMGGIQFAQTPDQAKSASQKVFGLKVNDFEVTHTLVEEQIKIKQEFYAGIIIDDAAKCPVVIFSSIGGTGIEEIAAEHPDKVARQNIDVMSGLKDFQARDLIRKTGISGKLQMQLADVLVKLWNAAKKYEARSAEINPLVLTEDGKVIKSWLPIVGWLLMIMRFFVTPSSVLISPEN